jgi:hypothetical protein
MPNPIFTSAREIQDFILARQGTGIDRSYCIEMLSQLCLARDNSEIVDRFKRLLDRDYICPQV